MRPATLHALNDRVVQRAAQAKVTKGRKLRVDATCVETTIHHPTDSGLLVDSVRVLSRLVQWAKPLLKEQRSNVGALCRSRLRRARRVAQSLHRLRRRKSELKEEEQQDHYRRLITTTEHMVHQAKQVMAALTQQRDQVAQRLVTSAQEVLPLIQRVIHQARTRVLEGKQVAAKGRSSACVSRIPASSLGIKGEPSWSLAGSWSSMKSKGGSSHAIRSSRMGNRTGDKGAWLWNTTSRSLAI
ncbi:MAG: hypothetical protein J2P36_37520, partial [Ktedonobacteraceae bacterium]|nr:hypothetical protein [Ktedonobacteraceae bacterium]